MIDALHIAATGMNAQQTQIDVTANNLANMNTVAYKKSQVSFADLMYRENAHIDQAELNTSKGVGVGVSGTSKNFSGGELKQTQRNLDVAIRGEGFFEVQLPDGGFAYTRDGALQINAEGLLVNSQAQVLNPAVQIPPETQEVMIKSDGTVLAVIPGEKSPQEIGRLEIANFSNTSGLKAVGNNLYLPTTESGEALRQMPGEQNSSAIAQGFLEGSNVKMVEELTQLILAQRAYEINSKMIQAADDVMGIINNLRR